MVIIVTNYRISRAANLLGVSSDTVRRWIQTGRLAATHDNAGRQTVSGQELAQLAQDLATAATADSTVASSARNRATGLVTGIIKDTVMAQVNLQCGPYRFVSLMSREAVDELQLDVGDTATMVVKATNVIVEKNTNPKERISS